MGYLGGSIRLDVLCPQAESEAVPPVAGGRGEAEAEEAVVDSAIADALVELEVVGAESEAYDPAASTDEATTIITDEAALAAIADGTVAAAESQASPDGGQEGTVIEDSTVGAVAELVQFYEQKGAEAGGEQKVEGSGEQKAEAGGEEVPPSGEASSSPVVLGGDTAAGGAANSPGVFVVDDVAAML